VLDLDDAALADMLAAAMESAWERADAHRAGLIETADGQIAAGRAAYLRLEGIVPVRSAPVTTTAVLPGVQS
jgi:hypothetical protein